jgi:lipopolysaccharide transport system permease protein
MPLPQYLRLVHTMAIMALRADASKYFLGYVWWVLEPLLYVGVFFVVFNVILKSRTEDFLVFLMCGKLAFIWFSKSVFQASTSIVAAKGLIGKINAPKTLFPLALIQEGLYRQAAVFSLLFVVLYGYGYAPSASWIWLVPLLLVNYLMIVACSFLGACLVCMVRDFSLVISLGMTFLLFTSGIFWDVNDLADPQMTQLVLTVNPVAFILDCYRQILMYHTAPDALHLALLGAVFAALTAVMAVVMHRGSQFLALKALSS